MLFGKNPARLLALNFVAFGALASQGMPIPANPLFKPANQGRQKIVCTHWL
jgi:hypothetical protein